MKILCLEESMFDEVEREREREREREIRSVGREKKQNINANEK